MKDSYNRQIGTRISKEMEDDLNKFLENNPTLDKSKIIRLFFRTGMLYYFDTWGTLFDTHEHPADFFRRNLKEAIKDKNEQRTQD